MSKTNEELKAFLINLSKNEIIFRKHFYDKKEEDRPYLNEEMIVNALKDTSNIEDIQNQSNAQEEKYLLRIKLSNNYSLVIISKIEGKNLYIITSWKTSKKWQKSVQK
jgi:hypothetical protein